MENVNIEIDQNPSHGNVKCFSGRGLYGVPRTRTNMEIIWSVPSRKNSMLHGPCSTVVLIINVQYSFGNRCLRVISEHIWFVIGPMVILAIMILIGIHKYPEDKVNFENLNQTGRVWFLDGEIISSWDFNDLVEQVRKNRHNYRSEVPRFSKEIIGIGWYFFSFWKRISAWISEEFPGQKFFGKHFSTILRSGNITRSAANSIG